MMKTSRAALTAILAALLLSGCTGTSQPTPSTSNSSSSPSTTTTAASPSPSTTTPDALAKEKSEAVLRAYFRATTDCMMDPPKTQANCYDSVAVGTEKTNRLNALSSAQTMETRTVGYTELASVTVSKVDLTSKLTETPPTVPKVVFSVCYDVSKVNVVDKAGKSIVPPTRKPRGVAAVTVYDYTFPDPAGWRVGYVAVEGGKTC
jgi:hypothetical protein